MRQRWARRTRAAVRRAAVPVQRAAVLVRRTSVLVRGAAVLALLAALALPAAGSAQGFRARATSALQYVELQPVAQDTVSAERVTVLPDGSLVFEGRPVTCLPGLGCTFYRVLPEEGALVGTQDVSVTTWGLGVPGLSATALLRARVRMGGDFVWPRSDDAFDALLAFAELDRGTLRLRAGRQETFSGLGFAGYDGVSARWAAADWLSLDGYGGRSLARGLSEPQHAALRAVESFIPDRNAWLVGGFLAADGGSWGSLGLRYQREIWSDRSGLVQERASLDAESFALRPLRLEGALDWDVAFGRLGSAHLTASYPLIPLDLVLEATLRRYLPYFQLSTIWGFFSPVAYREGLLRASWTPPGRLSARVTGGWRSYADADRTDFPAPLTDDGWRAEAAAQVRPAPAWSVDAAYRIEWGAGAFLSAADAALRWQLTDALEVGATATAFQQILEYRVGEGRVLGGGLSWSVALPRGARLDGGFAGFRHDPRDRATETPWNQTRAWTVLTVPFGEDPGAAAGPRLRR